MAVPADVRRQRAVAGSAVERGRSRDGRADRAHETTDEILSLYKKAVDESRAIARAVDLDQLSAVKKGRRGHVSMRWILLHMIEEVSRHLGHADIMRESIDGRVGDHPGGTPVVAP
jgi:hypothetical protein